VAVKIEEAKKATKVRSLHLIGIRVVEKIDLTGCLNAFNRDPHIHLALERFAKLASTAGLEPATCGLEIRCSSG
jgi:hypothetical protein